MGLIRTHNARRRRVLRRQMGIVVINKVVFNGSAMRATVNIERYPNGKMSMVWHPMAMKRARLEYKVRQALDSDLNPNYLAHEDADKVLAAMARTTLSSPKRRKAASPAKD